MEKYFEWLPRAALFAGINADDLRAMLACMGARDAHHRKGEMLLRAGDAVTDVGMLLEGGVQVIKEDVFGNRTILGQLSPGDLFAEAFVCAGLKDLPVSVVAQADSQVLWLNYKRIVTTCASSCAFHHQLIENMLGIVARKNVLLSQKIEHLSKRGTREKLLSYLSLEAQRAGALRFQVPFSRQALADYLCVERSAMSFELSKMQRDGLLSFHRNDFTLHREP